jgi:undecaprenyl-diphosphatase
LPTVLWSIRAALLTGGVVALVALGVLVGSGLADPFDAAVIDVVRQPGLLGALGWLRPVTELGSTSAEIAVALGAVLIGMALRRPWLGLSGALTIALASIANSLVKLTIARERPELLEPIIEERGFSFPSGHAALSAVAYGVIAVLVARSPLPLLAKQVIAVLMAALVLAVGASRVWLGVHYPTDVLAGWLAGVLVVTGYALLTRAAQTARAAAAVDGDRAAPRSDPPEPG